jgi:hypothetical protein
VPLLSVFQIVSIGLALAKLDFAAVNAVVAFFSTLQLALSMLAFLSLLWPFPLLLSLDQPSTLLPPPPPQLRARRHPRCARRLSPRAL